MKQRQPRTLRSAVLLQAAVALLICTVNGLTACPQPFPKVCAEFFKSDAVFVGTVLEEHSVVVDDFIEELRYVIRVENTFRGDERKTVTVSTENASARFLLEPGQRYLLFAKLYENRLWIHSCGNSGLTSETNDVVEQIKQILRAPGEGEISGRVLMGSGKGYLEVPATGARVVVRGSQGLLATVTDKAGEFRIKVPAGEYSIQLLSQDFEIDPYDLSYDDPARPIVIASGACAQFQYLATPVTSK